MKTAMIVLCAIGIALTLVVGCSVVKIGVNEANHNKPPLACIMLGGRWDFWNGWQCNV